MQIKFIIYHEQLCSHWQPILIFSVHRLQTMICVQ